MIRVEALRKTYRVPVKETGLLASLRSLYRREYREIVAVDGIDFEIEAGERVGFLGPNGAGKTTTLKMLTGLLHPSSGTIEVAGHRPQDRHPDFLRSVTLVMGQKQQLLWDLPASETFLLNRALFDLPRERWQRTVDELVEMLELGSFLDQPVRNLSLGQRMRAELAAALMHEPSVLFLDEPTIGLDVEVQAQVRRFIRRYNEERGATVMLTSHDMNDVAAIVDRLILIDHGSVRFDGPLESFSRQYSPGRRVVVAGDGKALQGLGFVAERRDRWVALVEPSEVNPLLQEVLRRLPTADIKVEEPPLEDVLTRAFGRRREAGS